MNSEDMAHFMKLLSEGQKPAEQHGELDIQEQCDDQPMKVSCFVCNNLYASGTCDGCNTPICYLCTFKSCIYWTVDRPMLVQRCINCDQKNKVPRLISAYDQAAEPGSSQ